MSNKHLNYTNKEKIEKNYPDFSFITFKETTKHLKNEKEKKRENKHRETTKLIDIKENTFCTQTSFNLSGK